MSGRGRFWRAAAAAACLLAVATQASAGMADRATRGRVAGVDVVTYRTEVHDVVDVVGYLPAGEAMAGGGNAAVPMLTGMMLDRGTRAQDQFAIARQLEEAGAEVSYNVGTQSMQFQARCLKKDLALVLGIIAAELRTPAFPAAEFAKVRQQYIGMLENRVHSTEARSMDALRRALYPAGHPNRLATTEELLAAARSATVKDVQAFHARNYGPEHLTIVLVGDVAMDTAAAEVSRDFGGWSGGRAFLTEAPPPAAASQPAATIPVAIPGKTSVSILLGQRTGLHYRDPAALALRVGTAVLGHGLTSRLMATVRTQEGLTYDIGAGMSDDSIVDGIWYVDASFAPKLLERGVAASRRTLQDWWQGGISAQELADMRQGLIGGYLVGLSTNRGLAGAIVTALQRGYDLQWLDEYPRAIQALTLADVNAAIHRYLDPASMVLVEAGTLPQAGPSTPAGASP